MKPVAITLPEKLEAYINPDHVEWFHAAGPNGTTLWLTSGKKLDIDQPVKKVARLFGWMGEGTMSVGPSPV
jgi:hypothetical protein